MSTSINIEVGFRGTATGLSRSDAYQHGTLNIKDASGRVIASSTLVGTGTNTSLTRELDHSPDWNFGPFHKVMTLNVLIEHTDNADAKFSPSKIVPVTVRKEPDAVTPQTYIIMTVICLFEFMTGFADDLLNICYVLSEDYTDNDFNDGIISVFQYK